MELKIIETPDYILAVSDEEIKEGDIIFYHHPKQSFDMSSIHKVINPNYSLDEPAYRVKFDTGWGVIEGCKKIIAYLPKNNAPELDLPFLPEIVVEDNVEKLALECFENLKLTNPKGGIKEFIRLAVNFGYNKGKLATKTFSEDDLAKVFYVGVQLGINQEIATVSNKELQDESVVLTKCINTLKQPKTPKWFVAEMEYQDMMGAWVSSPTILEVCDRPKRLKTTTINGKTYLVGTYLYK
jgi:hypothetical protein